MASYFDEGFCYRTPSWHREETLLMERLVLPDDRDEAVVLSGHDFEVIEVPAGSVGRNGVDPATAAGDIVRVDGEWHTFRVEPSKKSLYINQMREDGPGPVHGNFLEMPNSTYQPIQNSVGWDILEAIAGAGAKLETGLTLKGGALCVVTVYLDEPFTIGGDDSPVLPYMAARWYHDGTGALSTRSFMTRIVCANTDAIAEAEAKKLGTDFTFRHTKNWEKYVEDAKMAIRGLRVHVEEFKELSDELASLKVTPDQRELFVTTLLPMPPEALISKRVKSNVEGARALVRGVFDSPTVPEAHQFTGYGLRLAGVEYLDHLRGWRNSDTYVGRQLLKTEPAKTKLSAMIREIAKA